VDGAGSYGYKPTLPAIGGSEAVGIVDAVGEGVDQSKLGQRIAVAGVHGSWAEYFIAPAQSIIPLNDAIDDETAAQLIGMPISALMLLDFVNVQAGQWLIQNTANGAVGKTVAMIAQARGLQVINLVRRTDAIAEMQALGIQHVVADQADWKQQVKAIHADQPLIAGVDSIGGTASGEMLNLLSENSVLVSFGSMTGETMQISSGDLIFKQATVKGFWASVVNKEMPAERKKALFVELLTLATQKKLVLPVEGVFSFDDIKTAALKATQGARQGKVLLKP
jgi:NADPH2:quinone reductase